MLKLIIKNNLGTTFKILFTVIILLIASGCSKLHTDIPSAPVITTHNEGIIDPDSPNNHAYLVVNAINGMDDCHQCHAADYSGGVTEVGCNTSNCHPSINVHVDSINVPTSNDFHGTYIAERNWNMVDCRGCHNTDYSGGIVAPSCLTCHTNTGGPEACNTCHGDFNDLTRIAPPKDVSKNTATDSAGVGAHVKHLYDNQLGSQILCSTCHKVPLDVYDTGHVDSDLPAEVIFGNLAIHDGGENASYNFSNATCSETYCHGNWEFLADSSNFPSYYDSTGIIKGNARLVTWTQVDGSQAPCGSCHNLPPAGHDPAVLPISSCGGCHNGIVDTEGNIVDSTQHINGLRSVFSTEY